MKTTPLLLSLLLGATAFAAADRPNLVLIFADDLGYGDVSAYGSEIRTPQIDSLARDGAKLESFYVAAPVCTPSRFGLLTGRFPVRSTDNLNGALMFLQARDDRRGIRSHETTIATVLRAQGYRTALIGKWHLGHGEPEFSPLQHGFEHTYGCHGGCVDYFTLKYGEKPDWFRQGEPLVEEGYSTDLITEEAVRWLEQRRAAEPFFLFLSYTAPHYGKGWDPETRKPTNILQSKPGDRERHPHITDPKRREYAGMVTAMDDGIGRVLATLRARQLADNTLVIFTSDNGGDPNYGGANGPLRGQKGQLFEGGIREPCLMRWPGRIAAGSVITEPVTALDLFPTFAALAGADVRPYSIDGDNILPVLRGTGTAGAERALFWQGPRGSALRRGPWKYVREADTDYLFNLAADLGEKRNLAGAEPRRLAELKSIHAAILARAREDRKR
jgi:arylsulfatase A-like enzyme